MSLNLNDLRNACINVAKARTSISGAGLTSPGTAAILSEQFYEIAAECAKECFDLNRDPGLVNRAVWFLSQIKTHSAQNKDVAWFENCLGILLEMAFPDSDLVQNGRGDFLGHLYRRFHAVEDEAWG